MIDNPHIRKGAPCKYGHTEGRYITSNGCVTCQKLRQQAKRKDPMWGKRTAEDRKEYEQQYRAANAEKIRARKLEDNKSEASKLRKARYRDRKREELRAKGREYAQANKERMSEYGKEYRTKNRDKVNFWALKRWAAKLNRTPKWLTEADWSAIESLYLEAANRSDAEGVRYEVDHIIPLQGELVSGLHVPTNLRVIPKSENASKGNRYRIE